MGDDLAVDLVFAAPRVPHRRPESPQRLLAQPVGREASARGAARYLLDGSRESFFFGLEFALGALLPMLLLARAPVRRSPNGLYAAGLLVVMGFVVNRLNVSLTGFEAVQGRTYVPAWSELVVTVMLVALGFFAFGQAVKYLAVYPEESAGHGPAERPAPVLLAKAS